MILRILLLWVGIVFFYQFSFSQKKPDTTSSSHAVQQKAVLRKDSLAAKSAIPDTGLVKFNGPRQAALRSAIIPGWGQATNKKYWKIPIVYGALGATAYAFTFNNSQYKRVAYAYRILINSQSPGGDTSQFKTVDADLQPFLRAGASNDLRNYRNTYRKDIDYSVLIFLFFWGLNVVDATVDAHLKGFDVSDNLTMKVKPGFNAGTTNIGLGFTFDIHKAKSKVFNPPL